MSRNDITGDKIATKPASDAYRDGWGRIFRKRVEPDWQYSADGYMRTDGKVLEQLVSTGWSEFWERVR